MSTVLSWVPSQVVGANVDPLARSLGQLWQRSQAFGASFERQLRSESSGASVGTTACSGRQLVRTLAALAERRAYPARFEVLCRRLACRWRRLGACAAHCDAAGAALLRSLREVLGPEYDEVEEDWAELYGSAAEAMLVAAAEDEAGR